MLQGVLHSLRPAVVAMIASAGVQILITAFGKWNRNIPIWNKMDHDSDIRNMYVAAA